MKSFEISWFGSHFGEEPPISGTKGSGAIFFCRCNLKCIYCQNWQISQKNISCKTVSEDELLKIMLGLQDKGCHNINLVSPVIWSSRLKKAIIKAKHKGLVIPIVWNTNAYETKKSLQNLEGIVDIYLPDYKYCDNDLAVKYSNAPEYPQLAKEAILEMQRQVGDLRVDKKGLARKGLIVRHLILPGQLQNTFGCLKFIRLISPNIHLSLMTQYNPCYKASNFPEINREISQEEYDKVIKVVEELKFENGWVQEFGGAVRNMTPDFSKENPFKLFV